MNTARLTPLLALVALQTVVRASPGDYWQQVQGFAPGEWVLDHDFDGYTSQQEYYFGSNPRDVNSVPPVLRSEPAPDGIVLKWASATGLRYQVTRAGAPDSGAVWTPQGEVVTGAGAETSLPVAMDTPRAFFRLEAFAPADGDGDGLSTVDEAIPGTAPGNPDTDGDGLKDGEEIFRTFTDPLVPNPAGGTIRGTVLSDPDGDGITTTGSTPLAERTVYLDKNYDGKYQQGEPFTLTNAEGGYEFIRLVPGLYHVRQILLPGDIQTKPAPGASPALDGLPDEVVNYTHAPGGNMDVPYGVAPDPSYVLPGIIFPGEVVEVSPDLLLLPPGRRGLAPPIGVWSYNHGITLPKDASVLLRFDETIIDGEGPDLIIHRFTQGLGEVASVEVGLTPDALVPAGTVTESQGAVTSAAPVDLRAHGVTAPVRYVRITALDNGGSLMGFDLIGAEAVNYPPRVSSAIEVAVAGTEVHEDADFAVNFRDDPPRLFLYVEGGDFRAGTSASVTVLVEDDLGITARTLKANGAAVALDADGRVQLPLTVAGTVQLLAAAIDTGGHAVTREATLYVNNADGTSPFDPRLTGFGMAGDYDVQIVTPSAGSILSGDAQVLANVTGPEAPEWTLHYGAVDKVDPYQLDAPDPDWISLGSGTGFLANASAGTMPAASLPNGIYFLRLSVTPPGGGATMHQGLAVAKGLTADAIQPRVTITSPAQGTTVPLTIPITGSIASTRPLTEWFAEYAPVAEVDLNDPGSNTPPWRRFAQGTNPVTNGEIARFDATQVPDGSYVIRIVAWNDIRLGRVEPLLVEVAGASFKPGRLRREFTDVSLPLGGIPLTVRRVYDSLNALRDSGLGHGWSLRLLDPQIGETVPRTGSGMFGQTPFRDGTRVYLNTPDGKRIGFTFRAEAAAGSALGTVFRAKFIPDDGVYEKLETPEGDRPFLSIRPDGTLYLFFVGVAWNPGTYILTMRDGLRYTFDDVAGFVEARDLNGNVLSATADGLRHSGGETVKFVRNAAGRITEIQAPDGVKTGYGYDAAGNLTTVTDAAGKVTVFTYYDDPAHYLKTVADPLGRTGVSYEYDATGRLTAMIDGDGHRTEQSVNPGGFTGSVRDGNGNTTTAEYDARGNVTKETNALGEVTRWVYGDAANPDLATSRTDGRGNLTTWQYDPRGNVKRMERPPGLYEATFDEGGRMLTARAPDGQNSAFTYDERGNMLTRMVPGQATETLTWTTEGRPSTISTAAQDGSGPVLTRYEYDARGRIIRVEDNQGYSAATTFTAAGDMTGAVMPGGRSFAFAFDPSGTPVSEKDPYNKERTQTTLPDGTRRVTNRLNQVTDYQFGADGRLEKITRPGGGTTTVTRDGVRNVTAIEDAAGNRTAWEYDALNRPVKRTDAAGAVSTTAYDAAGNVVELVNRNGKRRTFVYDTSNRLTRERWHDAGGAVIREFAVSYHFNDWISRITDGESSWDFLGPAPRPPGVIITYAGQTARTMSYGWDDNGAGGGGGCCGSGGGESSAGAGLPVPSQITLNGGPDFFRVTATWAGSRLRRLQWSPPNNFFGPDLQFQYDGNGMLKEIRRHHNNSLKSRTAYTWDLLGRLTGLTHTDGAGVPLNPDVPQTLTRDGESSITSIAGPGDTAGFTRDALDQLTAVARPAGTAESYSYNAMGTRTASHLLAGTYTTGPGNRILTAGTLTFTYDAEGNVSQKTDSASGQVTRYSYDHRNQLTQAAIHPDAAAPAATTVEFGYDFAGRMISRSLDGAKTWIIYDRDMPFAEFADGSNAVNAAFLYAPDRADTFYGVWRAGGSEQLLFTDHIGTVQGAMSAEGAMLYRAAYDSFGNLTGAPPAGIDSLRFAGRFYNEALGLYEMRARFYDPRLGRFTQEDPLGFQGGDMNLYRYAGNNPLSYRDPSGTAAFLEYIELQIGIVRPGALCSFASCVSSLWAGVANAVVNQVGSTGKIENCALELFGIPSSPPSPLGAAAGYLGYVSSFGSPAPGTGIYIEALSLTDCMMGFGQ